MKKALPYIIAAAAIVLLITLMMVGGKTKHEFDDRITLNSGDKIPYGSYVAFQSLKYLFPSSKITVNRDEPNTLSEANFFAQNQALIIVTPQFLPDRNEMSSLVDFAKRGNEIFISTKTISEPAQDYLRCEVMNSDFGLSKRADQMEDSLEVKLKMTPEFTDQQFFFPGYRFDSYFQKYDSVVGTQYGFATYTDGGSEFHFPNFMGLKVGNGHIYLQLAPICFSNYFLLYHNNIEYYNKALSVIPENENKILWDEYYLRKYYYSDSSSRNKKKNDNDILSGLMSQPAFSAAVWLLVIALALYLFQEIRRKQRYIVEIPKPRNDSMEFVKTIGRLYYEKSDHKNLSRKMSAYFLEYVRNRYKLPTAVLNENFISNLQMKSGQPENNIRDIVSYINNLEEAETISPKQLQSFHKQLEDFYGNA